ncbi:hypothetical protein WISP_22243 [Willisornis vidua]|uniref:Uncharacterized protein n=1 Tax=Willisornis vidua TaxID=1566151 RepID=A0ABQ9DSD9_9PASS|nr:hypothetical protein WISP_22243 [Willisornis vidua]
MPVQGRQHLVLQLPGQDLLLIPHLQGHGAMEHLEDHLEHLERLLEHLEDHLEHLEHLLEHLEDHLEQHLEHLEHLLEHLKNHLEHLERLLEHLEHHLAHLEYLEYLAQVAVQWCRSSAGL